MSWNAFIKRLCKQDAVYWAPTGPDGFGGRSFAAPVEIKVRWEYETERVQKQGAEEDMPVTSQNVKVIHTAQLEKHGYLFLGLLSDITGDNTNPVNVEGAWRIVDAGMVPTINGDGVIYEHKL